MKKEGAGFDLPVAAAVLAAAGILEPDLLKGVMIVGEISLNGEIHGVAGVFASGDPRKRAGLTLLRYSGGKHPGGESGEGYAGVWSKKSE